MKDPLLNNNENHKLSSAGLSEAVALANLACKSECIKDKASLIGRAANALGREILVGFDSAQGDIEFSLSFSGPGQIDWPDELKSLKDAIRDTIPSLLEVEMPGFMEDLGATGRLRIIKEGDFWLDADDRNEDWVLERALDLDNFDENDEPTGP